MPDQLHEAPQLVSTPPSASLSDGLGKWIAIFGTLIAVGQSGTAWVHGYWQSQAEDRKASIELEIEKQKAIQELDVARVTAMGALAQQYLTQILNKGTSIEDRDDLLSALAGMPGNPLQTWATNALAEDKANRAGESNSETRMIKAAQSNKSKMEFLQAQLDIYTEQQAEARTPERHDQLRKLQVDICEQLADLGGAISIDESAVHQAVADARKSIDRSGEPTGNGPASPNNSSMPDVASAITQVSDKVTVAMLKGIFPPFARQNIEADAHFLRAALREFKVTDKRLAAAIIATVAVETPNFNPYVATTANGERQENKANLGNFNPGDGVLYRTRGYLGLTGRSNYAEMSHNLGLGNFLLDAPDEVAKPEIAFRILVKWFVERKDKVLAGLSVGDLSVARKIVSGTPDHLPEFTHFYKDALSRL